MLVSPPVEVIWTLATFEDSFQVRRAVWPASIGDGAEKFVTDGGCPMRMVTLAVVGEGGEAAVHDPDLVAVIVYVESAVGLTINEPVPLGLLENV